MSAQGAASQFLHSAAFTFIRGILLMLATIYVIRQQGRTQPVAANP
jgi:hypothetical protein